MADLGQTVIGMRRTIVLAGLVTVLHMAVLGVWHIDSAANHQARVLTVALVTLTEDKPAALLAPSPALANATTRARPRRDAQTLSPSAGVPSAAPAPDALPLAAQPALPAAPGPVTAPAPLPPPAAPAGDAGPAAPAAQPTAAMLRTTGPAAALAVASTAGGRPEPIPPGRIELPSSQAEYLQNPKPPYPPLSRRLGEQGQVQVRILIGSDGVAQKAEIQQSSGFERLDQAALAAALRWRYQPGRRGGVPETMWFTAPITFALE